MIQYHDSRIPLSELVLGFLNALQLSSASSYILSLFYITHMFLINRASEARVVSAYYHIMIAPTLGRVSSILPGIRFNQDVIDSSFTESQQHRDFNVWMREVLLFAGEIERIFN
jgi:hypothetical protein